MKVDGQWVPCVRNSYNSMPMALKLYMCYGHGLKICMCFQYIPRIIFFSQLELTSFFGHFSEWIEVPCVHNSSCSLIPILMKLYIHCDHALKICMYLGYTPQINFCHILAI